MANDPSEDLTTDTTPDATTDTTAATSDTTSTTADTTPTSQAPDESTTTTSTTQPPATEQTVDYEAQLRALVETMAQQAIAQSDVLAGEQVVVSYGVSDGTAGEITVTAN